MTKDEIIYLLERLEDYMDDKADASFEDHWMRPNKEMTFVVDIRNAIESLQKSEDIKWQK